MKKTGMRNETDDKGVVSLPADAFWGIGTFRALEICSGKAPVPPTFLTALALLRKAFANTNGETGKLQNRLTCAIVQSADEIRNGKWHDQFPSSLLMPAASSAVCRNVDEVLANRANHMLGSSLGVYDPVSIQMVISGLTHTYAFSHATVIGCLLLRRELDVKIRDLERLLRRTAVDFERAAKAFDDSSKSQFAQRFNQYGASIETAWRTLAEASSRLTEVRLRGSVQDLPSLLEQSYLSLVTDKLSEDTSIKLTLSDTTFGASDLFDDLQEVLAAIKALSFDLSRIALELKQSALLQASAPAAVQKEAADTIPNAVPLTKGTADHSEMLQYVSLIGYQIEGNEQAVTAVKNSSTSTPAEVSPLITLGLFNSFELTAQSITVFCKACSGIAPEPLP